VQSLQKRLAIPVFRICKNESVKETTLMRFRIAIWAALGLVIAECWGAYFANADKTVPIAPLVFLLARLSQPPVWIAISFIRFPVALHWAALANAATYAMVGSLVEVIRKRFVFRDLLPYFLH
jgi:hypothetical protein